MVAGSSVHLRLRHDASHRCTAALVCAINPSSRGITVRVKKSALTSSTLAANRMAKRLGRPDARARATRVSASHPAPATACGRFFCGRSALGRHRYRSCQPQPTASKPAPAKEMASKTLAWPPEKTENREASAGPKAPTSQGWRSRGQARKPRQHWGNGQKKSQPMRVGILGIGGAGGNRTRVRKSSTASSTYLVRSFGFDPEPADRTGWFQASHLNLTLSQAARNEASPCK